MTQQIPSSRTNVNGEIPLKQTGRPISIITRVPIPNAGLEIQAAHCLEYPPTAPGFLTPPRWEVHRHASVPIQRDNTQTDLPCLQGKHAPTFRESAERRFALSAPLRNINQASRRLKTSCLSCPHQIYRKLHIAPDKSSLHNALPNQPSPFLLSTVFAADFRSRGQRDHCLGR